MEPIAAARVSLRIERRAESTMLDEEQERRVRERAYRIWQEEGCPEGRETDHWERARELVVEETGLSSTLKPAPSGFGDEGRAGEPVEPPEALADQGDFPSLTDQAERQGLPRSPNTGSRRKGENGR